MNALVQNQWKERRRVFENSSAKGSTRVSSSPARLPGYPSFLLLHLLPPSFLSDAHADYSAAQCEERVGGGEVVVVEEGGEKKVLQKSVTVMSMS